MLSKEDPRQELFNYLSKELGVTALSSEMSEIENIVLKAFRKEAVQLVENSNECLYELRGEWKWKEECNDNTASRKEFTALNKVIGENMVFISSFSYLKNKNP